MFKIHTFTCTCMIQLQILVYKYMYVTFKFYAGIYMAQGLQCGVKVEV